MKIAIYNENCVRAGEQCFDEEMIERESNDITIYEGTEAEIAATALILSENAKTSYDRKRAQTLMEAVS